MQKILILDFGGQYAHLIARRVRQLGLYGDIRNPEDFKFDEEVIDSDIVGIIFSGGPRSVKEKDAHKVHFDIQNAKVPILGICYGHQLIASLVGGDIHQSQQKEYGLSKITCNNSSTLFDGMATEQIVWMSHGDHVESMPNNFIITSSTDNVPVASYESKDRKLFGVQFHPEVTHSENGLDMLDRFLSACTNKRDWKVENYKNQIVEQIRKHAKGKRLFLLLSGGVDSLVALRLCIDAVGEGSIYSLHVDTGYMRKNESIDIIKHFEKLNFKNIAVKNAEDVFLEHLKNVTDPETKRKIIGRLFVDIMHEELGKMNISANDDWMLVQGTIYPDTVESGGTKNANTIKTHHNRVSEIDELIKAGKVIEPLKDLYKDEVREVGRQLGLPSHLVDRHPFPGPGLAIRILCSDTTIADEGITKEEPDLHRLIKPYGLTGFILPIRSVGVQGDFRTYHHPALVYYNTRESNTPDWNSLKECSSNAINKLNTVNRMIFSHKPIEVRLKLNRCYPNKKQVDLLREVDYLIYEYIKEIKDIWQMPVVSLPLYDENGDQCFVMRPINSKDAMTADVFGIDFALLNEITKSVKNIDGVGQIFYDITSKPPGTIEWE